MFVRTIAGAPRTSTASSQAMALQIDMPPTPVAPRGVTAAYVGRIDRRKGVVTAVRCLNVSDAATSIWDRRPPLVRSTARPLRAASASASRCARPSGQELPALYAAADAVLFPVLWQEPWGLVPLEAMAVGTVMRQGQGGSGELPAASGAPSYGPPHDHVARRWPSAWCGYATSPTRAHLRIEDDGGAVRRGDIGMSSRRGGGGRRT